MGLPLVFVPIFLTAHLSLSARQRTAGAYLDTLQRLLSFGLDPLTAERGELEAFLSRNRPGEVGRL